MKYTLAVKLTDEDISKGYVHVNRVSRTRKYRTLKSALSYARRLLNAGYLVWIEDSKCPIL